MQITYNGIASQLDELEAGAANPGIFAIANADYSVNSESNPTPAGSYVVIYGTGQGVSRTAQTDGEIMSAAITPVLPVTAQIDGQPANVLYAGSAPGLVAGVLQINLAIPSGLAPGSHALTISAGTADNASQGSKLFTQ
jgi:uncharacterized protein (TIGR03437 family)